MNDYRPFPTDALPSSIARYVLESSSAMGCDPAFVALPSLSALAACIGTTREVELKPGWCEPAAVWSCIIARSGTMKSPAMEVAIKPLADAEHKAQVANQATQAEYETSRLKYEKELVEWKRKGDGDPPKAPERPARLRYIVSDTTLEALAPLLQENPRGELVARDELAAWVRGFGQYKKHGGGDAASWLELNRAGRLTVDRKADRNPIYVPRALVSVCGTIQPGVFADAMRGEHFESGLAARLLIAQPPTRQKRFTTKAVSAATASAYAAVFRDLLSCAPEQTETGPRPVRLRLAADAREAWRAWYDTHARRQHEAGDDVEAAALAKIEAYAARLGLIFALVDDPVAAEVSADAVQRGCVLADWFACEAERVYGRLAEDDETRELRRLIEWIDHRGGSATARDLSRGPREYRGDVAKAGAALERLAESGIGTYCFGPVQPEGGKQPKVFTLNPRDSGDGDETPCHEIASEGIGTVAASPTIGGDVEWGEV